MRTLKFRGKVNGCWCYATPEDTNWEQFWYIIDRETLGQYADLNKKKEEVYEGDIIAVLRSDGGVGVFRGIVKHGKINLGSNGFEYDYWVYGFYVESMGYTLGNEWMTQEMIKGDIAVVGNIHDNPELLKEVEE